MLFSNDYFSPFNFRKPQRNLNKVLPLFLKVHYLNIENEFEHSINCMKNLSSHDETLKKTCRVFHPNRRSLKYRELFKVPHLETVMEQTKGFPYLFPSANFLKTE